MKRFFLCLAGLCILLCHCSIGEPAETGEITGEKEIAEDVTDLEETGEDEIDAEPEPEEPEPAAFLGVKANSETDIDFEFSSPVRIISLSFDPELNVLSVEDGSVVKVCLEEGAAPGARLLAELEAEDEWGNELSVQVAFRSRNNRVPEFLINEMRTDLQGLKAEFIEFKMLSDGNLGALRVFAAGYYKNPMIYQFSPVEVQEGEYVVLHMRTLEASCVDEYGELLDESGGTDSCPVARDFWIPGSAKRLHKTDAVYVMDQDDNVLDAVMISEFPDPQWKKDYFAEAAAFLFSKDAWKSGSGGICAPMEAVSTAIINTAMTRSVSRNDAAEDTNTAADWYVTSVGGISIGLANKP